MTSPDHSVPLDAPGRPKYRVPIGMPVRDENRREGAVVSVLIHATLIFLLIFPFVFSRTIIERIEQGAGGPGPAGGGGGGHMGEDGQMHETLRFVRVAPQVTAPTPKPVVPTPKPVVVPPKPIVKPVVPKELPPEVTPPVQTTPDQASAPATPVQTVAAVGGTGTGRDGTNGNGPGSGGGVGSGVGTGRGSGTGPGTGGGLQANYPPQPIEFFLPPLPPPSSVRGTKFTAEFDVDSTGKVVDMRFTETRDGDYNRRLAAVLRAMKFRPGTRPDGTPLRMKAQVLYEF
jgi:protein TonB